MTSASGWERLSDPERGVALEVLVHGPLSRSDLARRVGLSPGSLTRLAGSLLEGGLLREDETTLQTTAGRAARGLSVVHDRHRFVGVRLTSAAVDAVLTDMGATVLATASKPLASTEPDLVVATVAEAVAELAGSAACDGIPVSGVGVGLGARIREDGSVSRAVYLGWDEVPLAADLEAATGIRVHVANDVVALTTAEHWFGAGRGEADLAVVTIGTGIGSGLVVHDRVLDSVDAGVGLLGHLPLGLPGPLCPDGHVGCATAVLTEDSLTAQAAVGLRAPVTLVDLVALAADPSQRVVARICADLAVGLGRLVGLVANVTQVRRVVVAGECVPLAALVLDQVHAEVASVRHPDATPVDLTLHEIGTEEWARGAAAIAVQRFVTTPRGRKQS